MRYIFAFILVLTAHSVFAVPNSIQNVTITSVGTGDSNDRVNIYVSGDIINPAGCTYTDFVQVNEDAPNRDSILSLALYALATKTPVQIYISTNDGACSNGARPKVRMLRVHD